MQTPREIYTAYKVMPGLQTHQLRVAAVGKLICENFTQPIEKNDVVLACLFHDMGNIVKFKLDAFPEVLQPEGLEYWEKQKAEMVQKYGPEQHHVSETIAQELGLPDTVIHMIGNSGVSRLPEILVSDSAELKIMQYADLRVAPSGVVSLAERFEDFARRYLGDKDNDLLQAGQELEEQIFLRSTIQPEDINDAAVAPLIGELSEYPVA